MRKKTLGHSRSGSSSSSAARHSHRWSLSPPSSRNRTVSRLLWWFVVLISSGALLSLVGLRFVASGSGSYHWWFFRSDTPTTTMGSATTATTATTAVDQANHPSRLTPAEQGSTTTLEDVRREFYQRYGDQEAAERLYRRGVTVLGKVEHTAARLLRAAADHEPFVLSFAGYSVTVGRGNHFHQSYPFVLSRILQPLLRHELQVPTVVRNAAIGGIPSYPYGFCFEHFLGRDASVISWDYSMNEGKGAAVLESYLRQSQSQLPHRPMLIVLDTNEQRCQLVRNYADAGLIQDALCVGTAKDAVDDPKLFDLPEDQKPPGFQHWDEFGAPPKCPGRGSWHPKKMEHELIGWMIAMYFVEAVAVAKQIMIQDSAWKVTYSKKKQNERVLEFPQPMEMVPHNDPSVTELLYGHAHRGGGGNSYTMKSLSCRTNFLPATDADKVLPSIVVAGLAPGITADNIMVVRSNEVYATGWVLDVSSVERDTKVKVEQCGGLGYIDMKIALYGIPESGPLRMWLPVVEAMDSSSTLPARRKDLAAKDWSGELIICEANEKRKSGACRLDRDIEYTVGGVPVTTAHMIAGAAEYLKRQTCVHVGVPDGAVVTHLSEVQSTDGGALTAEARRRLIGKDGFKDDHLGLIVDLQAKANVSRDKGACCVSHVVWEQQ